MGMEASALSQLGQRGKRLNESSQVGLAILKQIVTQYRSKARFSSFRRGGLRVRIVLFYWLIRLLAASTDEKQRG